MKDILLAAFIFICFLVGVALAVVLAFTAGALAGHGMVLLGAPTAFPTVFGILFALLALLVMVYLGIEVIQ